MYRIEFTISDDKIANLNPDAKEKLKNCSKAYAEEIIKTAKDVEANRRQPGANISVTDNHIIIAADKYKTVARPKKWFIFIQFISDLLLFVAGLLFTPELLVENGHLNEFYLAFLLVIFAVACVCTIFTYLNN